MPDEARASAKLLLRIVADLVAGEQHSRHTISETSGRSPATADSWMRLIRNAFGDDITTTSKGKTKLIGYRPRRGSPGKQEIGAACVVGSLASIFAGTAHQQNVIAARDRLLRLRGTSSEHLDRKFLFVQKGGEYALPEASAELDEVIDAVLEGRRLQFTYRHNDGRKRRVAARGVSLVIFEHQFYLLGLGDDGAPYSYRFARMSRVSGAGALFPYPPKNEFDPEALFRDVFGIHISRPDAAQDIRVVLTGGWATFAETHRWHRSQQTERRADGSVVVKLRARVCPEIETWVLGFGEHATVEAPTSLRGTIGRRLGEAAGRYAEPTKKSSRKRAPKVVDAAASGRLRAAHALRDERPDHAPHAAAARTSPPRRR